LPYIKQEYRPPIDALIRTALTELLVKGVVSEETKKTIGNFFAKKEETQVDGQFNYFITKTLKELNLHKRPPDAVVMESDALADLILSIIHQVYQPKYYNYNRAVGVLTCAQLEFQRRYGKTFCDTLLQRITATFYNNTVGPYENIKIQENGDV